MKNLKKVITGLLLVVLMTNCEKVNPDTESKQKLYFEYSYYYFGSFSFATDYWIIDNQGYILDSRTALESPDVDILNSELEKLDSVLLKVDKTELDYYVSLIPNTVNGEISEIKDTYEIGGDYLGAAVTAYCYILKDDKYERVLLYTRNVYYENDKYVVAENTNLDTNAVEIYGWLMSLNSRIHANK